MVQAAQQAGADLTVVTSRSKLSITDIPMEGYVKKINAAKGDSLAVDDVILEFA